MDPSPHDARAALAHGANGAAIEDKVRVLSEPGSYPHAPAAVSVIETHMSWVFLAGDRVYKLKKPLRSRFFDFTTLAAREINCREEVRLNRRLAPETYLGMAPLTAAADGTLALDGTGRTVDWLVVMRRLPSELMLDRMLSEGLLTEGALDRIAAILAPFYALADHPTADPASYLDRFVSEQAENRAILTRSERAASLERLAPILDRLDAALAEDGPLLEERARSGHLVDGHGDLRPDHICLTDPVVIFDCLEFSPALRLVDPFDELAFLGMECRLLGAAAIGPALIARLGLQIGAPEARLIALYTAFRAVLRARQSAAHLLDPVPRDPARWGPLARRYLAIADTALE